MMNATKALCWVTLAWAGLSATWAQSPTSADALIENLSTELFDLIETNRVTYQEDPEQLRSTVDERMRQHIDTLYSARLILGRYGRGLSREQIEAFATAMAGTLMDRYAERLLELDSQNTVEILPLEANQDPRRTRVRTRLRLDNGSLMPIDYVMRWDDTQWLVFDVIVEGISYVATFRNQIGEQIAQDGFDAMLERLQSGQLPLEAESS